MMKRIAVFALVSVAYSAFAAVPAAEPPLPPDIGTYETMQRTCVLPVTDQHPEKTLVMDVYQREDDQISTIITISLDGTKVTQRQYGYDNNLFQVTYFIFVKNSPQGNWIKFGADELEKAGTQLGVELGLTQTELGSCDGQ